MSIKLKFIGILPMDFDIKSILSLEFSKNTCRIIAHKYVIKSSCARSTGSAGPHENREVSGGSWRPTSPVQKNDSSKDQNDAGHIQQGHLFMEKENSDKCCNHRLNKRHH